MSKSNATQLGWCSDCGKRLFDTKSKAKRVARQMRGHLNVYRCPVITTMYHVGNLAPQIISGEKTRSEIYGRRVEDQVS